MKLCVAYFEVQKALLNDELERACLLGQHSKKVFSLVMRLHEEGYGFLPTVGVYKLFEGTCQNLKACS